MTDSNFLNEVARIIDPNLHLGGFTARKALKNAAKINELYERKGSAQSQPGCDGERAASAGSEPSAAVAPRVCDFCDRVFPHYHSEALNHHGDPIEVIVHTFPDLNPRAEVRDSETGEVIFPAVKGPLMLVEGGLGAETTGFIEPLDEGRPAQATGSWEKAWAVADTAERQPSPRDDKSSPTKPTGDSA